MAESNNNQLGKLLVEQSVSGGRSSLIEGDDVSRFLAVVGVLLFAIIVMRSAWLSDDAYITFRTVDNWAHGYGLTWNIGERVQTFTHPLWMFVLAAGYALTHEIYFTSLIISMTISLAGVVVLVFGIGRTSLFALIGVLCLTFSKAFIDFSTSGLENPLTHLLLVLFYLVYLRGRPGERSFLGLALLASLGTLNRMDSLLLFGPGLAYAYFVWPMPKRRALGLLMLGFIPFFAWVIFSLFYYGFIFPNTAYAKLNTGINDLELLQQGFLYLLSSINYDSVTLVVIGIGLAGLVWAEKRHLWPIAAGVLLYLVYTVKIGGDFMTGRFMSAPLLGAVIVFSQLTLPRRWAVSGGVLLIVGSLVLYSPYTPLKSDMNYDSPWEVTGRLMQRGPVDERAVYYKGTGLLWALRPQAWPQWPDHAWVTDGRRARAAGPSVKLVWNIGFFGFYAGPQVHVIDGFAVGDPLLARLPAAYDPNWRIGHFNRVLPPGYLETWQSGRNMILDADLGAYYDHLTLITRGSLWDARRLEAIWKMNTGQYDYLINYDTYRFSPVYVSLATIETPKTDGAPVNPDEAVMFTGRLDIDLGETTHAPQLEMSLDSNDDYQISYFSESNLLAQQVVEARMAEVGGLVVHRVQVPDQVTRAGYSRLQLLPLFGDGVYGVGHLRLITDENP